MKNWLTLAMCIFAVFSIQAQTFSPDRKKFAKEFHKVLENYGKGTFREFSEKLLPAIIEDEDQFPELFFAVMVNTSNKIIAKRLSPYPALYNYVYSVYGMAINNQTQKGFDAWHVTVDRMIEEKNSRKFDRYTEMTAGFFFNGRLYEASNYSWYYKGGDYVFDYTNQPIVRFQNGNLVCLVGNRDEKAAKKQPFIDSIVIYNTEGTLDPLLFKWRGDGGKITWEKVGMNPAENYAEIRDYSIALKSSQFSADSVAYTTPYFEEPIMGLLTERAFIPNRKEDLVYPQFQSYDKQLFIKDIKPGMDFLGGLAFKGANLEGLGDKNQDAKLTIFSENKVFITAKSQLFLIDPKRIRSFRAQINMRFADADSITHPGAELDYSQEKNTVELSRTNQGIGQAPFNNSYHQLDMYIPKLIWGVETIGLEIGFDYGMSREKKVARLESTNFFDLRLYDQLQGMESLHPLVGITNYANANGRENIPEGMLATSLEKTIDQAKITLLQLANMGFIMYDTENKIINVNQKAFNFVESRSLQRDYDNLMFVSDLRPKELKGYTPEQIAKNPALQAVQMQFDQMNAERERLKSFGFINLVTKELYLAAVDQVVISANQSTSVFPRNFDITIRKNRDFDFKGYINAGKLSIDAEISDFVYDDFKFNLTKSNKTNFRVKPLQKEDGTKAIPMVSQLTGVVGELQVDDPTNRSGMNEEIIGYPKLNSVKPSYIYYNSKDIYRGAYDSVRFYYTAEPFLMDSLDDFSEAAFRLKGELTSAGIFPKIKQDIKIMPDYSFGFSTKSPEGGYEFYGSEAKFDNKIVLSNNGLQGAGTISYINSTSTSKAFSFLPDSTIGVSEFTNVKSETAVEFPEVYGKAVFVTYIPKGNILKAQSNLKNDLQFFGNQAILKGTAFLTPKGMSGRGLMNFLQATLISDNFSYKCYDIFADTSDFILRNTKQGEGEDRVAFRTNNVKADVSFKDRKGEFASNDGTSKVEFPVNKYICRMDKFSWEMESSEIQMSSAIDDLASNSGVEMDQPNFFSTNDRRDTLSFKSSQARFSLEEKTIFCDKVNYVDIADARIYPNEKKMIIRKDAKIDPLSNAKIVANYITRYHTFTKAEVKIGGKKDYSATGEYPYYDVDSNATYIHMDKIGLDTSFLTVASGKVTKEMGFKMSNEFEFYGDLLVNAVDPLVRFKGATRIVHDCEKFQRSYLSFDAPIDPTNIQIPVSKSMQNLNGEPISAGIVWRDSPITDSIRIYPTFLSSLENSEDPIVMTASGVLQYDFGTKEYQIGPKAKFLNPTEPGNIIKLSTSTCSMAGSGLINLGMDYGPVDVKGYADMTYNQETGITELDMTLNFIMPVDKGIFQDMATRMSITPASENMDLTKVNLEQALIEFEGQEAADKFKSDYTIKGEVKKIPESFQDGLVFTGVKMRSFNKREFQEKGLVTNFEPAVMVSAFNRPVCKVIEFDAFFMQTYSGAASDKFMMKYQVPGGRVYYFDYTMEKKDGELRIISGDKAFQTAIQTEKEDKLKSKNFKYGITDQKIYVAKFNRLIGIQ